LPQPQGEVILTQTLRTVVACVAEAFRERRRRDAVQRVILSAIQPLDWRQRCVAAKVLLDAGRDILPDQVLGMQPERLVDCLEDLIMAHLHAQRYVDQFIARASRA